LTIWWHLQVHNAAFQHLKDLAHVKVVYQQVSLHAPQTIDSFRKKKKKKNPTIVIFLTIPVTSLLISQVMDLHGCLLLIQNLKSLDRNLD
jgi:hypothetical protein